MISIAFALLLRAFDAPLEVAQREAVNPIPVVAKATHSDPQAIEWLRKIDRTEGGDGSCYIEFARVIDDPVWKVRVESPVKYFFVKGKEGRLYVGGRKRDEAIIWTAQEFVNFNFSQKCLEIKILPEQWKTPRLPNRWFLANLVVKPDIEYLRGIANITVSKEDDSNIIVRISPIQKTSSFAFSALNEVFKSLYLCDPNMILGTETIDLEIEKQTHHVASVHIVEPTKTIQKYVVQAVSTDRKGIEQSLDSKPIQAPEGWKVDRYTLPVE